MASSVAHVIGFSSLLIFILVSIQFIQDMQISNIQRTARILAMEVSHRVSRDLTQLANIASRTNSENMFLVKRLDMPETILGKSYRVKLSAEEGFYKVQVEIMDLTWLEPSTSEISVNASSTAVTLELGEGKIQSEGCTIKYSNTLLSGASNPVAWLIKDGGAARIGVGVIES